MVAIPSQQTFTAGTKLTAAQLNDDVRDAINFLLSNKPRAKAYAGAATTHNSSGPQNFITVALNSESFDTDSIHDNTTNNSRLTCQTAGWYRIEASLQFATNASGTRASRILKNGTDVLDSMRVGASPNLQTSLTIVGYTQLAVNDYIELQGAQNSGGNLDMQAGEYTTWLAMEFIRP